MAAIRLCLQLFFRREPLAGQKRIVATVSTLEEEVERQGVETPAIIVVGKVCYPCSGICLV